MRIILIGLGVVGQAFLELLELEKTDLYGKYGLHPVVVAAADSSSMVYNPRGLDVPSLLRHKRSRGTLRGYPDEVLDIDLVRDVDAEVVVEVTPSNFKTGEPGISHIRAALQTGKHVITANKGPLAIEMPALVEMFQHKGLRLLFSGTVGGGTPFLRFVGKCLSGERIVSIRGVVNGTTNYILNRMEEGKSFQEALREAQEKGYAEADPSNDVDGWDSAAKLVILSNWAMDLGVTLKDVSVRGIRGVEITEDMLSRGKTVRLIASADESGLRVQPEEIDKRDPLVVPGALNAVSFTAEISGRHTLIGKGAGGRETAAALIRDLVELKLYLGGAEPCS